MRERYHQELDRLESETLTLGHLVASAIPESIRLLAAGDLAGARRLVAWDDQVNARRHEIELDTLALIATQGPMAGETRFLAAILDVSDELERIGDYAKGIASITLKKDAEPYPDAVMALLVAMAQRSQDMLVRSLEALHCQDVALARMIIREDDAVDALFNEVFAHVITAGAPDTRAMERANYLLWVAHNLERTADRVTNICERVIFTAGEAFRTDG